LHSGSQYFNCVEFDLFVFLISSLVIWFFMFFFLSNLIFILFISIYFAINLFSDWILFFNLIPNHLILIFFSWIWSLFFLLQILLFWLISMIFFFVYFIPHCFIQLNFHIILEAFLSCF
jgi:hypothetical protein